MSDKEKILKTLSSLLETGILTANDIKKNKYNKISFKQNPYGDGKSCIRIAKILKKL